MQNNYILNKFNFGKNRSKKVYEQKCRCLPRKNREEYKKALRIVSIIKNVTY